MILTREEQAQLAGLSELPAYQALLRVMRADEERLLAELRVVQSDQAFLERGRFWQAFSQLLQAFETTPGFMQMSQEREEADQAAVPYDPVLDPMKMWLHNIDPEAVKKSLVNQSVIPSTALAEGDE